MRRRQNLLFVGGDVLKMPRITAAIGALFNDWIDNRGLIEGEMKRLVTANPNVSAGIIKTSSVATPDDNRGRPHADTTYWITPQELCTNSLDFAVSETGKWAELKSYKPLPGWSPSFFTNLKAVYDRRMHEMYGPSTSMK